MEVISNSFLKIQVSQEEYKDEDATKVSLVHLKTKVLDISISEEDKKHKTYLYNVFCTFRSHKTLLTGLEVKNLKGKFMKF